ncbi:hypothetical protein ASA1KI_06100 [Opitutales bacterium ASA1]|uniref:VanZ family protein n=1 Tax=Congregicoccus parvus TaxID=3081749 RepID=UPI002B285A3E|nr:hypothetical protein ASA1KI_06100 [Opitutales bacterium ASA1]
MRRASHAARATRGTERRAWARTLAWVALGVFAAVFVAIIVIANRGEGARWWGFLETIPYGDKLGHFGLLGTFSLLLNLALRGRRLARVVPWVMLGSVLLAVAITAEECSQAFLASRTFDLADLAANFVGIAAGEVVVRWILRRRG